MKTIEEVKGRCYLDDEGHWLWRGCFDNTGYPKIYAPDYAREGAMRVQTGGRAVYSLTREKAIPKNWRVMSTCGIAACINPEHIKCMSSGNAGKHMAKRGAYENNTKRRIHSAKMAIKFTVLTPEITAVIDASEGVMGTVLAKQLGISETTISRYRRGVRKGTLPMFGMFSGLIAANDAIRRRA